MSDESVIQPSAVEEKKRTNPPLLWQDLSRGQRVLMLVMYTVAYTGPAYWMLTERDLEWEEKWLLFLPWTILTFVVCRFWPPLRDLCPGCLLGTFNLFVACIGAGLIGKFVFPNADESVLQRIAIAAIAAVFAARLTRGMMRQAGEKQAVTTSTVKESKDE